MSWIDVGPLSGLPARGARVLRIGGLAIAVFRTGDDRVYALVDRCPHRGGPLSQGIVHGCRVTCPLHDWVIDLETGRATGADEGSTRTFSVQIADGRVLLDAGIVLAAASARDCPHLQGTVPAGDCPGLLRRQNEDGDSPLRGQSPDERPLAVFEPG